MTLQGNLFPITNASARFSADRTYRYTLKRQWFPSENFVMFIGLNPSTADETRNDPTVRRCIDFAQRWGFSGMVMMNLFAFRATAPRNMKQQTEPIGEKNDFYLLENALNAKKIVACWSQHGSHLERSAAVVALLRAFDIYAFKLAGNGQPYHPLYLPKTLEPFLWRRKSEALETEK